MTKRILLFLIVILQIIILHFNFTQANTPKNYFKGKFYNSVSNHFLIATEKMNDDSFKKTVIVMLENDKNGAWGLVINKQLGSIPIALLIDPSLNTPEEREQLYKINVPIFWGGPVEKKEIFILHTNEYSIDSTKKYGNISITQDYKILFDIAKKRGPEKSMIILGYSGWASGQLEGEMEKDDWILSELDIEIIFENNLKNKWQKALKKSFINI